MPATIVKPEEVLKAQRALDQAQKDLDNFIEFCKENHPSFTVEELERQCALHTKAVEDAWKFWIRL